MLTGVALILLGLSLLIEDEKPSSREDKRHATPVDTPPIDSDDQVDELVDNDDTDDDQVDEPPVEIPVKSKRKPRAPAEVPVKKAANDG